MVVVHDYTKDKNYNQPSGDQINNSLRIQEEPIDEEHAFWVGIWVLVGFVVFLIMIFGIFTVGRRKEINNEEQNILKNEVAGQKNINNQEDTTIEQNQESSNTINVNPDQENLELDINKILSENPGSQLYVVESGDTLFSIGQKNKVDWKKIAQINRLEKPYTLHTGQKIVIPSK